MSQAFLGVYTADGSRQLADWSLFVRSCHVTNGKHGYDSLTADIDIPFFEAFTYYNNYGPLRIIAAIGPWRIFEGRIDDPTQFVSTKKNESGLKITVFGAWVAFSDLEGGYTALWSTTSLDGWREMTEQDAALRTPSKYVMDHNSRLWITLTKGTTYTNANDVGALVYRSPDNGSRLIVGLSFDYVANLPTNWLFQYIPWLANFTSTPGGTTVVTGTGAQVTGSINVTLAGCDALEFVIFNNSGVNYNMAGETGTSFIKITNIRFVTSTTNRINTVLTANRNAGTNVTATVGSTSGMYVGQRLTITGATSESIIVLSIGSSTQFNATFVNNYVIPNAITGHVVYPDEIIKDCLAAVAALNPSQISASTGAIQSQRVDLTDRVYEDATPGDVITDLVDSAGDDQTTPRQWVALIYEDRQLIVRPRGSGRAWYIDADELEVQRSLNQLFNSVVVTYKDGLGRKLRSMTSDSASVARYGITRRKNVSVDTTLAVEATRYQSTLLASTRDPIPRVRFPINAIYDSRGNWHPLWMLRANDTVTIRNFPPTIGTLYDKIRTLVVTRVTYDLMQPDEPLDAELEIPLPNINVQLARSVKRG